ncbi:MAG: cobaltochelatase subunit CobN, partial [Hyphomicrobiales bacterium]|nr:cobaltochelatase subunit CobN [Hyphomicrobiales bacterium]
LFALDPRVAPTRAAEAAGVARAEALVARHAQDHGEPPRRIAMDLWGGPTLRTGGEAVAQALALMGVRPTRDAATARVSGFEVLAVAALGRPRVDVLLRVSGLFRDMFPGLIGLIDSAARAVAARAEEGDDNPLAREGADAPRLFGPAPGAYGAGLARALDRDDWRDVADLGADYLALTDHAYAGAGEARRDGSFAARAAAADAHALATDAPSLDALTGDAGAHHAGGFAAASRAAGGAPTLYHLDASAPGAARARPLAEEIARIARARLVNPVWIAGLKRHGHRGAGEIAEALDNLAAYAGLAQVAPSRLFDLCFDAYCADADTRRFLREANPAAARAIAGRFRSLAARGLWISRRNSVEPLLDDLAGRAP